MSVYNKVDQFVEDAYKKVHNLSSDALTLALTAAVNAPVATNTILANLVQIAYTNLSSRVMTITTAAQTAGLFTLLLADQVLTAAGGAVAAFRYIVLYNDTPIAPVDPLIGWWDYGSDLILADGETLTVDYTTSTLTHQ